MSLYLTIRCYPAVNLVGSFGKYPSHFQQCQIRTWTRHDFISAVISADVRLLDAAVLVDHSTLIGEFVPIEAGPGSRRSSAERRGARRASIDLVAAKRQKAAIVASESDLDGYLRNPD